MNVNDILRLDNKGRAYEKFRHPYLLVNQNWNDGGYYTLFTLYKTFDCKDNLPIAQLHILSKSQIRGDTFRDFINVTTFITDPVWASRLLCLLSYEERLSLIETLKISFEPIVGSECFTKSVLRNTTLSKWTYKQNIIKNILTLPFDINNQFLELERIFQNS